MGEARQDGAALMSDPDHIVRLREAAEKRLQGCQKRARHYLRTMATTPEKALAEEIESAGVRSIPLADALAILADTDRMRGTLSAIVSYAEGDLPIDRQKLATLIRRALSPAEAP